MRASAFLLAAALPFAAGCRYDPVPQAVIDALGPEEGTPSATHRPGQPCIVCHSTYEGASPAMAVAGTVFTTAADGSLTPAVRVSVIISDSAAGLRKACTNAAGNFYVEKDNWLDITFPLNVQAGNRGMTSLIGRDGSCASCHKLPDATSENSITGAGHGSPGVVIAEPKANDPACGGAM